MLEYWDAGINKKYAGMLAPVEYASLSFGIQRGENAGMEQTEVGGLEFEHRHKDCSSGNLRFRSTWDIIKAAEKGLLPDKIMINVHPQRWTDNPAEWTKELVWQNFKNMVKKWMVSRKAAKPQRRALF